MMRISSLRVSSFVVLSLIMTSSNSIMAAPFMVAESMTYKDKVDLSSFGVQPVTFIYESQLLPKNSDEPYKGQPFEQMAAKVKKGSLPVVLDVERWNVYTTDPLKRSEAMKKYINVITNIRKARPDLQFAYYSVIPYQTYWTYRNSSEIKLRQAWRGLDKYAGRDLAPFVDAIFPSLYTSQDNPEVWRMNAEETLIAAHKFNKPVYCVLWPQYWKKDKLGIYVPADYWRLELETCKKFSDGIVIWNYDPTHIWDPTAKWWLKTLEFLKSQNLTPNHNL
jgi:hypothetical protein